MLFSSLGYSKYTRTHSWPTDTQVYRLMTARESQSCRIFGELPIQWQQKQQPGISTFSAHDQLNRTAIPRSKSSANFSCQRSWAPKVSREKGRPKRLGRALLWKRMMLKWPTRSSHKGFKDHEHIVGTILGCQVAHKIINSDCDKIIIPCFFWSWLCPKLFSSALGWVFQGLDEGPQPWKLGP